MFPKTLGTYVYLSILNDTDPEFARKAKDYSTFNPSASVNAKGEAVKPIYDAISQLKNIAATQAQKEHQAIKNYIRKIDKHLQNKELPEKLRKNLLQQKQKIQNIDFENYKTDQIALTQAINVTIQDLNSYERRLKEITSPIQFHNQFQNRLEFNIQQRLEKFLENQGKKTHSKYIDRDKKMSDMMEKQFNATFKGIPSELAMELKALLYVDFNNWVENNSSQKKGYTSLTIDDIEPLFNEYIAQRDNELTETHFQRILRTSNENLMQLVTDMQKVLHSTYLTTDEYKKLQTSVDNAKKNNKKSKISFRDSTITYKQACDLIKTYNYNVENDNGRFAFTLHSSVSHGNFYEFMKTIIMSAVNIEGNVAGDLIIPIGTATFSENEQKVQKELMSLSSGLQNILTEDFKQRKQLAIEDFDTAVAAERTLTSSMQEKISKAKENINELDELNEEFFIAHESTKLYKSSELQDSEFEDFHGRNMAALQALAKLYASPVLEGCMIDPKKMMLYLINISDATLAANHDPLETYLSLFAGLLMFDDISTLAQTGIQQIQDNMQTSTVDCLHVYDIGGVYFPISVILNNLTSQMDSIINNLSIDYSKTAVAEITGPTPSVPEQSTKDSWAQLANETIQGTKIQIHFLAGFTEYVSQLFNNFGG